MTTVYACKLTEHSKGKKAGHFAVQDGHNFSGHFFRNLDWPWKTGIMVTLRYVVGGLLHQSFGHFHYSAQSFTYGFGRCCQHIINCNSCSLATIGNVRFAVPVVKTCPSLCLSYEEQLWTY